MVDGAAGSHDPENSSEMRMISTPWSEEPVPFNVAAETGTRKVITEHSTIGIVVTTDGSISSIPRHQYEESEARVVAELKKDEKAFRHPAQQHRSLFRRDTDAGAEYGREIRSSCSAG